MRTETTTTTDGRLVLANDYEGLRWTAAGWHGGQWTALYALASTGTITHGLAREARQCLAWIDNNPLSSLAGDDDRENLERIADLENLLTETDD